MRVPILAGNWKMHKTVAEALELVAAAKDDLLAVNGVDKVFCPPFMAIADVARALKGTDLGVGAQDLYWEESGAYTGEVSAPMIREFADYVIIGHSERRQYFHETDETVNRKIKTALAHQLTPIVCVGESLELRQADQTESWVADQVSAALKDLTAEQVAGLIIAYEPIWAIGTGLAATAEEAERVCGTVVRAQVAKLYDEPTAAAVRVQYGGSVKPGNTLELMSQPNIDGALIGGASLQAADFCAIVRLSAQAKGLPLDQAQELG
ncbi:MAG: triose-phosphate isomerase [Anaerolineae bacterium]|nr:triose-phosphate isomerase [Anaerolineae bacterium]